MAAHGPLRAFDDTHVNHFDKCNVLLFEAEADFRRHTREMLNEMGFESILDTGDFDGFQSAFGSGDFDLIIGDTGAARGDVCDLVHRVRHNIFGVDPFAGIILTMADPSENKIRRAANSGTDHLIAKPYSPIQVFERIQTIIDQRKRFIVTINYVGPERREGTRVSSPDELITVPNALRAKVRNDPSALATPNAVRAAMNRINLLKVQRHDLEIGVLVEMLRNAKNEEGQNRRESRLKKLGGLVARLQIIAPETEFGEATPMCEALLSVIKDIRASDDPSRSELDRLTETSMALHLCFHPEKTVSMITREISDAVAAIGKRRIA